MNQVLSLELDQQVVQVLPFPIDCFPDPTYKDDSGGSDDGLLELGVEHRGDPLRAWLFAQKYQVFEFCGAGKVKYNRRGQGSV